jgi:hypothetical protein
VNEVSPTNAPVDVGSVDMTFDLTGQGPVTATDLRLLVDVNNNGMFVDDPAIAGAIPVGGNLYRFAAVSCTGEQPAVHARHHQHGADAAARGAVVLPGGGA